MPPVPGTDGQPVYQFNAIDAISPANVWAVGYDAPTSTSGAQTRSPLIIEHS